MRILELRLVGVGLLIAAAGRPQVVSPRLTLGAFGGSGVDRPLAMIADAAGNVYIAGTTTSLDLPVKNAAQPVSGESYIQVSIDRGATFSRAGSPPAPVSAIAVHPQLPGVLFAGGSGIFKSTDAGKTWRTIADPSVAINSIAIDPGDPTYLVATGLGGTFASSNTGETWTKEAFPLPSNGFTGSRVWFDPKGSGTAIVTSYPVAISTDRGQTWSELKTPPAPPNLIAFDPIHAGWIYEQGGNVYLTTDNTATWTRKTLPGSYMSDLVGDPANANVLYGATSPNGAFVKTTDGAQTWFTVSTQADLSRVAPGCTDGTFFGLGLGGFTRSVNAGLDWTVTSNNAQDFAVGPGCAIYAARPRLTSDAFVAKFSSQGNVLWATYLGGNSDDAAQAVALDASGNLYVAGNTRSSNFPATGPAIGPRGNGDAFVTKFSADGQILYSRVLGGESLDGVSDIAIDPHGNATISGATQSVDFPVTPGAFQTTFQGDFSSNVEGFVAKLNATGGLAFATYLGPSANASSVAFDPNGEILVTGGTPSTAFPVTVQPVQYLYDRTHAFLARLSADGSRLTYGAYIGGTVEDGGYLVRSDGQGSVYVAGTTASANFPGTSGAYSARFLASSRGCPGDLLSGYGDDDVFVFRLRASDLQPIYATLLGSGCYSQPSTLQIGGDGSVTLTGVTASLLFPLRQPFLGPGIAPCNYTNFVAQLSADGSDLPFSSYLDDCSSQPTAALAPDGSVYLGGSTQSQHILLQRITPLVGLAVSVDGVANAFSGFPVAVAPGELVAISGTGLSSVPWLDQGLDPSGPLSLTLGTTQVFFDGVPAPILSVNPGRVICVAPNGIAKLTTIRVVVNGQASNDIVMPVASAAWGLLTRDFPNVTPRSFLDGSDGNVRNADGTLNDAAHPAAAGSTVTLLATGVGLTSPPTEPGAIATTDAIAPAQLPCGSWTLDMGPFARPIQGIGTLPGFVTALFEFPFQIPMGTPAGTLQVYLEGGVSRIPLLKKANTSNAVSIYVAK